MSAFGGNRGPTTTPSNLVGRELDGWCGDDLSRRVTAPDRVRTDGKHLSLNGERHVIHGATYGSFVPRADGALFPVEHIVHRDFAAMAERGLNTVRIYSTPTPDVLQAAAEYGLRLLVGVDYPDWRLEPRTCRASRRRIRESGLAAVRTAMEQCAGRPEVLAISVGNEVPNDLVRVHGIKHVEDTLSALVAEVHAADPDMLSTYTNFPTTEFLQIDDLDLFTFNVFLEDPTDLRRYLAHLQIVSGTRPLVLTELGLASEIHGESAQAASLAKQLLVVDESGCAGATVFSWTDEWGVSNRPVKGWGFGLTDAHRRPKPALQVVSDWSRQEIRDLRASWPRISVVVCAYNEERNIGECLESLVRCDYPNLEVLVCDDGSTDATVQIAGTFPFRLLELPHGGLSRARNAGIGASSGEIVAFLDTDAVCHAQWPWFLALSLEDPALAATGGPNLPFEDVGLVERAVALSPGAPTEVLISDDRAEHVPGCNMAFRRDDLLSVGCFEPVYTSAGDDVDVCWKLLDAGRGIGFSPAAQVIHHRRGSVRGYLRQQHGYGRAEKLLSGAHPQRFNRLGQARWSGFIYGGVGLLPRVFRPVVYHGSQGLEPFQSISRHRADAVTAWGTALIPSAAILAVLSVAPASLWSPALLLTLAAVAVIWAFGAAVAISVSPDRREPNPLRLRLLVAGLHVAQSVWRTWGRLRAAPVRGNDESPEWTGDRIAWLRQLDVALRSERLGVRASAGHEHWDFRVSTGPLVRGYLTVGVAWNWIPHWSLRLRSSSTLGAAALVGALLLFRSILLGAVTLAILLIGTVAEAWQLRRRVHSVQRRTTSGSRSVS